MNLSATWELWPGCWMKQWHTDVADFTRVVLSCIAPVCDCPLSSTRAVKRDTHLKRIINGRQTTEEITVNMGDDDIDYNIVFPEALISGKWCSEADSSTGLLAWLILCLYVQYIQSKMEACKLHLLEVLNYRALMGTRCVYHWIHVIWIHYCCLDRETLARIKGASGYSPRLGGQQRQTSRQIQLHL